MSNISKPDIQEIWAETGAVIEPSKEKTRLGWTVEAPPHQYENWVQNRQDRWLAYLNQKGVSEWSVETSYYNGKSFVQDEGSLYKCVKDNGGEGFIQKPSTDSNNEYWQKVSVSLDDIKQTTGNSTKDVVSQKLVTDQLNLKVDKNAIKQTTGVSTTDLMSQKTTTDQLALKVDKSAIKQSTGQSATDLISQKAITDKWTSQDAITQGIIDRELVVEQEVGFSTTAVMSQAAVTDAIGRLGAFVGYGYSEYFGEYGLEWDSVKDTYQRTGAMGYTSIQSMMKRCVLNDDGTVNYYLNPFNSNYKEDGSPAVLDGTDGNVMVEIPKFYVKYSNIGDKRSMSVALGELTYQNEAPVIDRGTAPVGYVLHPAFIKGGVPVENRYYRAYKSTVVGAQLRSISGTIPTRSGTLPAFRTLAEANGDGWSQTDWNLLNAIRTLLFIEVGSFDAQKHLGLGNVTGGVYGKTTGASNHLGNFSSSPDSVGWMSYRGIENFYGGAWEWVDGANILEREVFVNGDYTTYESDLFETPYESTGLNLHSSSYTKDSVFGLDGIIPTTGGGSSSTYITDYVYSTTGERVVSFGGRADRGLHGGASCFDASVSSARASSSLGAGVSF